MIKNTELLDELEDVEQKCEEIAALSFVTWNSFTNNRFCVDTKDYEPVLRVLMDHATRLDMEFKGILSRLYDKEKGGAGA